MNKMNAHRSERRCPSAFLPASPHQVSVPQQLDGYWRNAILVSFSKICRYIL